MADGDTERPAGVAAQYKFDAGRLTQADRITGIASLITFIALFLPWFGYQSFIDYTVDGLWHGYEYIVLILCLGIVLYLLARAGFGELSFNKSFAHAKMLLVATVIDFVLVLIGFLDKPGYGGVGWRYGAFVALIASAIAAFPNVMPIIQARRAKP